MKSSAAVLAFALAVLYAVPGLATQTYEKREVRYVGTVPGDAESEGVKLWIGKIVREGKDTNRYARILATYSATCGRATNQDVVPFRNQRRFRGRDTTQLSDGKRQVDHLSGRLIKGGRAEGWLSMESPSCSSGGRVFWRAKRVSRTK